MCSGTCNLHGPLLRVLVRWPWAALGRPALYPVFKRDPWNLPSSLDFTSALAWTAGKCPSLVVLQPCLQPGCTPGLGPGRGVPAPLGSHCTHRLHRNSGHHLPSCSSVTVPPNNRNHPRPSSLGRSCSSVLQTLSIACPGSHRRRSGPDQKIPAAGASGISPGLIRTKQTLCFSQPPREKINLL